MSLIGRHRPHVSPLEEVSVTRGGDKFIGTSDINSHVNVELLKELKTLNFHLSLLTDADLTEFTTEEV